MSHDDYLKDRICTNCYVALLVPHQEFLNYFKCPLCGFTKIIIPREYDYIAKKFKDDK